MPDRLTHVSLFNRRTGIHGSKSCANRLNIVRRNQIRFRQKNPICETDLSLRFQFLIERFVAVLGINNSYNAIQTIKGRDRIIHEKRLCDRARIGNACCFNNHAIKRNLAFVSAVAQIGEHPGQIAPNGAANAAVAHLNNLFFICLHQKRAIDIFFTEFIFNHSDFVAMIFTQNSI